MTKRADPNAAAPRTRPGGRTARVRSAVLTAVVEELAAVGYASFSVEGVAERAGVHKTTVYRRWRNRENLLLEAMLELGREQVPLPDTGSLRSDLLAYGKAIVAGVQTPEVEAGVRAIASIGDPDSPLTKASHSFWDARLDLAGQIVDRAIARKEIQPGVDARVVVEAIIAPIYFRLLLSGGKLDRRFLERLADFAAAVARKPGPT
jgi:AcrR family transcriptional regulator